MADIQTTYPTEMSRGMVGQKARTSAPFDGDRIKIGAAGLKAGDLFTLDASGDAIPITSATQAVAVEGALMYEPALLDTELAEYSVGDHVEYMVEGYIYGEAGAALDKGDAVIFHPTDHNWIKTGAPVATQLKVLSVVEAAADEALTVIKIGARVVTTPDVVA